MKDFNAVDAAIITHIMGGYRRFCEIWPPVARIHITDERPDRVVDRRLQALRKNGKLICRGQKWYVNDGGSKEE